MMPFSDDDNMDALMELYANAESIESAAREKKAADDIFEEVGIQVKNYPNPQRELDLHGQVVAEAMIELENFIKLSIFHRIRTVRVITGKGLHSKGMVSVLPEMTEKKLAELRRAGKVLAFRREKTGGSFAVYLIS